MGTFIKKNKLNKSFKYFTFRQNLDRSLRLRSFFVMKYVKKRAYRKYKTISQYILPLWQDSVIIIIESRKLFLGGQYEKGDRK